MTVYIVFGTPSVARTLLAALIGHALKVDLAGLSRDASEAIDEIRREKPHLVIVEEILSKGFGMDVIESVRNNSGLPALVMVSALPWAPTRAELRRDGIDLWLQLPNNEDRLHNMLDRLLDGDPNAAIARWRQELDALE